MMKVIVALCVVFALAQAAHQTYWYSGSVNTTGTPYANPVDTSVSSGCATLGWGSGYRNFTVNVTTAGFYYFTALFERDFKSTAQIQVYSGSFNPANACTNLVIAYGGASGVPHIEMLQYFTPGLYPVVVTGRDNSSLGLFSIHVDVATLNGATNEYTSNWWTSPSYQYSGDRATCEDGSYVAPFTTFSFYQNGTASTDILVFGYNSTTTSYFSISAALYNSGTLNFTSTGNQTNPVSGCTTPYFVYGFGSTFSDLNFNLQSSNNYAAAGALALTLNNGVNYTLVVGSYQSSNAYTSKFGVFMRPTVLSYITNRTFTGAPYVTQDDCSPSSRDVYFGINTFTAQYSAYILDNPPQYGIFFDASGCLYSGLNTGNGNTSPINCPGNTSSIAFIQCGDTGDGGPVASFLTPGNNYTWIEYQYSGTGTPGSVYLLYNYSGKQLGNGPVTTTAAATTGSATTSGMEMSSSSASTVVVMMSLYIAAMFF